MSSAICGLFFKHNTITDSYSSILEHLVNKMLLSSPKQLGDSSLCWIAPNLAFGQIDNSFNAKSQCDNYVTNQNNIAKPPISLYDSELQLAITAYARIDNRSELCKLLNLENSIQLTDHKLLLLLYKKFGHNFATKVLGDFAIAIWDKEKHELLCITDIMNCRPIYYFNNDQLLAFATEIRALHAIPEIQRQPDLIRVANQVVIDNFYINNDYRTYFANIKYLPGATALKVSHNNISSHTYWQTDLNQRITYRSEEEYVDHFNDIFTQAVKARINTASPIGVMLSGGLDSSALTSTLTTILTPENRHLQAFANVLPLDYAGIAKDEREYITKLATDNLTINYIDTPIVGPFDDFLGLVKHIESPNYISQQYIHQAINLKLQEKQVKVLLDGVYGEMGPSAPGYGQFARIFQTGRWFNLVKQSYLKAQIHHQRWPWQLVKDVLSPLTPLKLKQFKAYYKDLAAYRGLILNHDFVNQYSTIVNQPHKLKHTMSQHILNQRLNQADFIHYKQHTYPVTAYIEKSGVELLHPYLDRRILEFCLAIPDSMRFNHGYNRYLIRRSQEGMLPKELCQRITKSPFIPDYVERCTKDLPKAIIALDKIKSNPLVRKVIDITKLTKMLDGSRQTQQFTDGKNAQAFMIIATTLALGVFLTNF